jgi:hypothetical protein
MAVLWLVCFATSADTIFFPHPENTPIISSRAPKISDILNDSSLCCTKWVVNGVSDDKQGIRHISTPLPPFLHIPRRHSRQMARIYQWLVHTNWTRQFPFAKSRKNSKSAENDVCATCTIHWLRGNGPRGGHLLSPYRIRATHTAHLPT